MLDAIYARMFGPRDMEIFRTPQPRLLAPIGSIVTDDAGRRFRVTRYSEPYVIPFHGGGGEVTWIVYGTALGG